MTSAEAISVQLFLMRLFVHSGCVTLRASCRTWLGRDI